MRQADFFTAPTSATQPAQATAPAMASTPAAGGASFSSVFRQVQNEVNGFIGAGSASHAAPPPALTPEGLAYLGRSQPGSALAAINQGGSSGVDSQLQQQFLDAIKPWAEEAGARLGVAPEIVAAHAALESGWGQRPLRQGGQDSNNLFGVKAGKQWSGDVTSALTTEYEGGAALKKTERFRSYPDQASAFRDYAQVLLDNPRYKAALGAGSDAGAFAQGLARGGYATDPAYADKLARLARLASRLQQQSK
ncbi:glycoside hydrolase family 73 protein [Janthinobacterium agaricidamnosum]|uniref:Mannosyl-glycoendo-beta-N-acetylglucosaminidase family protein n=1 Tax=Janthinobacterium agaricidamnosum NBRC 102515 = DSM 9628 TaxID=1349767 RepID=W0V4P0_9BURK|nr:glucosaminidase domain-containing protein [Janthinobacterium agaricidamnosum]CDG82550.1 mannosyl-glycoendo-beta-N-acetylglucosaminidase family protein [Janthinobacterium agaricidamnosum NBRC 102515 = DSM 9628]